MWTIPAAKNASIVAREVAIQNLVEHFSDESSRVALQPVVVKEPVIDLSDLSFVDGDYVWFVR